MFQNGESDEARQAKAVRLKETQDENKANHDEMMSFLHQTMRDIKQQVTDGKVSRDVASSEDFQREMLVKLQALGGFRLRPPRAEASGIDARRIFEDAATKAAALLRKSDARQSKNMKAAADAKAETTEEAKA